MANVTITTVVDIELHKLCKTYNIDWKPALEQGIYMLLVDKGHFDILDLPNNYNKIVSELARVKQKVIELQTEINNFKNSEQVKETAEEQAEDFFNNLNGEVLINGEK